MEACEYAGQTHSVRRRKLGRASFAGRDRMMTFQELADEAFADLLKKHNRPVDLRSALRKSANITAEVIPLRRKPKPRKK